MKILRSVNRRGFNVGTAGSFTVLRPNTWFAASRLSDSLHSLGKGATLPDNVVSGRPDMRETTMLLPTVQLNRQDPRVMRTVSVVAAAFAITSILLWWIMHP
jgi:hypothetical protein